MKRFAILTLTLAVLGFCATPSWAKSTNDLAVLKGMTADDVKNEMEKFNNKLSKQTEKAESLSKEVNEAKAELAQAKAELAALMSDKDADPKEVEAAREAVESVQEEVAELSEQLQEVVGAIETMAVEADAFIAAATEAEIIDPATAEALQADVENTVGDTIIDANNAMSPDVSPTDGSEPLDNEKPDDKEPEKDENPKDPDGWISIGKDGLPDDLLYGSAIHE